MPRSSRRASISTHSSTSATCPMSRTSTRGAAARMCRMRTKRSARPKSACVPHKPGVPSHQFTAPPPRDREASLVKELERLGIGRPSTYAAIISTLRTRWYATAKDRRFHPTPQGETVWKVLKRSFPEVFEVGFTAQMETELDKVEEGDLDWQAVLGDFWGPFNRALEAVDINKIIHEVHDLTGLDAEKCPKCGAPLEVRSGRFGPYIACSRYA